MSAPTEQQGTGTPFNVGYPIYQPPAPSPPEPLWASAAPLGFAAFAMITLMLWLQFWGALPKENAPIIFPICLAGGIAQIVAGMIRTEERGWSEGQSSCGNGLPFYAGPGFLIPDGQSETRNPGAYIGISQYDARYVHGHMGIGILKSSPVRIFHITPGIHYPF